MPKILAIGIGLVDIYKSQKMMYPGGNEYNISYYIRELGGESSFMGVFADDKVGEYIYLLLKEKGVDISHSRFEQGSSGYAIVDLVKGNRLFLDWNKKGVTDLHPIQLNQEDLKYVKQHDIICISNASRLKLSDYKTLFLSGIPICYDFSDSFTEENIRDICPLLYFSFFSCSHINDIEKVKQLLSYSVTLGSKYAIAMMGECGSLAYDGNQYYACAAKKATVVDTMGAGDSFIAAFILHWFCCLKSNVKVLLPDAMEKGASFAGINIGRRGSLGVGYEVNPDELFRVLNI
ncbi:MAG: PfkB family carbohydrate kinase [Hydrogenoanaerobacterium sp.]